MNYNENWRLIIDHAVEKQIKKISRNEQEKINEAIVEFTTGPYTGDIEKMKGEKNVWRRRVGSYRIFYEILSKERAVYVYEVKRRTSNIY